MPIFCLKLQRSLWFELVSTYAMLHHLYFWFCFLLLQLLNRISMMGNLDVTVSLHSKVLPSLFVFVCCTQTYYCHSNVTVIIDLVINFFLNTTFIPYFHTVYNVHQTHSPLDANVRI